MNEKEKRKKEKHCSNNNHIIISPTCMLICHTGPVLPAEFSAVIELFFTAPFEMVFTSFCWTFDM
jgi:hypothetical protein